MRTFLVILTSLILLAQGAYGEEAVLIVGQVIAVDRDAGKVSIIPLEQPSDFRNRGGGETPSGDLAPGEVIVSIDPERLPAHLRPGTLVRVSGAFAGKGQIFAAESMRISSLSSFDGDRTGVRRRLGRSRGSGGARYGRAHGR